MQQSEGSSPPRSPDTGNVSLASLGPAVIVASVVLGPGSILINSQVGWKFGYTRIWVLLLAAILMWGMTTLAARVGLLLDQSPCEIIARRVGRPIAIAIGVSLFTVASSFQFSNNLGVLYGVEPIITTLSPKLPANMWQLPVLIGLNAAIVLVLVVSRSLYRPVERSMKWLVMLMLIGFAGNLVLARPDPFAIAAGCLPGTSQTSMTSVDWLSILGLVGTTFSVAAAFYQAYLVRQKGWTANDIGRAFIDGSVGIATLAAMSLMVMITAASVLHGNPEVTSLTSAADVAFQLRPLFGPWATVLFAIGILAGALSSFVVNAIVGGTMLADGIGKGHNIDTRWPRYCTITTLLIGMTVAIAIKQLGFTTGQLIVFAQAITVLGNPLLAASLLWLSYQPEIVAANAVPTWLRLLAWLGLIVVSLLSGRTVYMWL
ncbi:MAG: divalent metal cation transporter [Pirellulaceae bacterium]|nr:divalent metal cation transporter [Planctomycetales bacterium]